MSGRLLRVLARHTRSVLIRPATSRSFLVAKAEPQASLWCLQAATRALSTSSYAADDKTTAQVHSFKAETKSLLDIVAKSLYSEPEVFVRELVSNAADALEKLRYQQATNQQICDAETPLEIRIEVNDKDKTFSIQDSGIGMNEQDLVQYLGTIAHSGSKEFVKQATSKENADGIIGQFGVGFYSTFMVAKHVSVLSKAAALDSAGVEWESSGEGTYTVKPAAASITRGTKITLALKDDFAKFSSEAQVIEIVKKYSNFINANISVNGKVVNTVKALWTLPASQIKQEEHVEFYRFISNAWDEPRYTITMNVDAPLSVRALLYVPTIQREKFGLGQMEPGVSLYSRKVLIQSKMEALLPPWLRFIRGVVDSEDISLNVSRELLQDNTLITRLRGLLTTKIIRYLEEQSKENTEKYLDFIANYSRFIREGIYSDQANASALLGLLRFETSTSPSDKLSSLSEYISRMPESQKAIYYLCCSSRRIAETSPYLDALKKQNIEVVFMMDPMDPVIMNALQDFKGKKIVSVESSEVDDLMPKADDTTKLLSAEEESAMRQWLFEVLGKRVSEVVSSSRLVDHPAVIVDHESASIRRIRQMLNQPGAQEVPAQKLEINGSHEIIHKLNQLRAVNDAEARVIAEQIFDNALMVAGLLDEPRLMVKRINQIMQILLSKQ